MHRLRRLGLSILAVAAVTGAAVAWRSEADAQDRDPGDRDATPTLATPVLSVRRTPALTSAPFANRELAADLQGLVPRFPEGTCLVVAGPDIAFEHRADVPMIPASTQKLLTATAALEVLGTEEPVLDMVGRVLSESDNPTAEALLRAIGGSAGDASSDGGAAVVGEVLADLGTPQVVDGTGLSRENRVTCRLLVDLLLRPVTGELLHERLPVAGESGTLAERFVGTSLQGTLRAKTGSLSSVASLAGFVDDGDPPLAFALVVNAPSGTPVPEGLEGLQREVGEALARWPHVPAGLGPEPPDG